MSKHKFSQFSAAKETKVEQKPAQEEVTQSSVQEEVTQSPVVQETPKPEVKQTQAKEVVKPQPKESFTPVFKVEIDLIAYSEALDKSKIVSSEEGAKWQYSLFTTLKRTLNNPSQEEFNKEWTTILNFFHKNKDGIFNEYRMFLHLENWPGSPNEYIAFRSLVFLLIQTADPKVRKTYLRDKTTEQYGNFLTEHQKNTLLAYYS